MTPIEALDYSSASEEAQAALNGIKAGFGRIPNLFKTMAPDGVTGLSKGLFEGAFSSCYGLKNDQ